MALILAGWSAVATILESWLYTAAQMTGSMDSSSGDLMVG